jgi:DNA replication protein DnaC
MCHDGWQMVDGLLVPCRCQLMRRVIHELPPLYRDAQMADIEPNMRGEILNNLAGQRPSLLFSGPTGTGKTHVGAAIVRQRLLEGKPAKYLNWARVYATIRETYGTNGNEWAVLQDYFRYAFLLLDDLGSGSLSDFERRCTFEILDQRISHSLPTIVTTNLSLKTISELLDDRIASRLSTFTHIRFKGTDRRLRDVAR